jgi:hypothetical protein
VVSGEDGAGWLAFLRGLLARGLSGVALVISDAHAASAPRRTEAENALADAIAESRAGRPSDDRLTKYLLRSPQADTVGPVLRLRLIQHLINDTWNRQQQLQNLLQVLPTILELGGPRTAQTIAAAVRDVSSRWAHVGRRGPSGG